MEFLPGILLILFAHWIADFVMQTDGIAKNKSKCISILTQHVTTYISVLTVICVPLMFLYPIVGGAYLAFILFNGIAHWFIDFITSKISADYYSKGDVHKFFVTIGLDQYLHTILLIISFLTIAGG